MPGEHVHPETIRTIGAGDNLALGCPRPRIGGRVLRHCSAPGSVAAPREQLTSRELASGVFSLLLALAVASGCGTYLDPSPYMAARRIDGAIFAYHAAAQQIELGDSKERVLSLLEPTQSGLAGRERKSPDRYQQNGTTVEIYYFRSGRQPDGLTTDDEFTPYLFVDGTHVAVGWAGIGQPSSRAQAREAPSGIPNTSR